MRWIVVRTRRLCEHLVKQNLEEQRYEVYLPLSVEPGAPEPKPFFPGYIFADTAPRAGLWRPITNTRGVTGVLMTGETPSFVAAAEIVALQEREEDGLIQLKLSQETAEAMERDRLARATAEERAAEAAERLAGLAVGTRLHVDDGSFSGFDVEYARVGANHRIWVFMSMLGGKIPVQLPAVTVSLVA